MARIRVPRDYRELIGETLPALGYELVRSRNHLVFRREADNARFTLPITPSDWRSFKNDLATLRRDNPGRFETPSRTRRRDRRERERNPGAKLRTFRPDPESARPKPQPVAETGCEDCGRKWLSDLTPWDHTCPDCDGRIRIAPGDTRWEPVAA